MAADLNRVILIGRLTRDVELKQTASGTTVGRIRLAVGSRVKQGEQWVDRPNFFDVTVFGRQAETAETYLSKGRRIGVDGRLSWREWEAKDGSKRQAVSVIADNIQLLGGDSRKPESDYAAHTWQQQQPQEAAMQQLSDEEIPF